MLRGSGLGLGTWGFGGLEEVTPGRRVWKEAVSVACLSITFGVLAISWTFCHRDGQTDRVLIAQDATCSSLGLMRALFRSL